MKKRQGESDGGKDIGEQLKSMGVWKFRLRVGNNRKNRVLGTK